MTSAGSSAVQRRFIFGAYELLPERRRLRRGGQDVELVPKAFDALVLLVERSPGLVTKEELMAALWANVAVSESSLSSLIFTLRKTLGTGRWVETIPRRGYQFVGEVRSGPDEGPVTLPEPVAEAEVRSQRRFGWRWTLTVAGIVIVAVAAYSGWRWIGGPPAPTTPLIGKYIQTVPFAAEGFPDDEIWVADAITHSIRWRLEYATRD